MTVFRSISCIILISLLVIAFLLPKFVQGDTSIKVVAAQRTKEYSTGTRSVTPKGLEDNVLLVLRIEGISINKFNELADEDKIYVINNDNQYKPSIRETSQKVTIGDKTISPWILCVFSIPENILEMELVVGDYPPVEFKAEKEIFAILKKSAFF